MKRMTVWMLALALMVCLAAPALAHEAPDLTRRGAIDVWMHMGEEAVPGGSGTLYRVGAVAEEDGNVTFVPTGDFADCGLDFAHLNGELTAALAELAQGKEGLTQTVDGQGRTKFENLELGLYLIVQQEAAPGYQKAAPFLVSVPYLEDGTYRYEVEAGPKVELEKEPEPTQTEPPVPTKPDDPQLPNTGQLDWPIPVLAISGLAILVLGWFLRFGKKEKHEA